MGVGATALMPLFVLLVLLLPPPAASSDILSPLLPPIFDGVCNAMECGKGKCKRSQNISFPFKCQCDAGWIQPFSISFLPCVIPNCTITASCSLAATAPSPAQLQQPHTNRLISDPCTWGNFCGSGKCNSTSPFTYSCLCSEGSSNLLNTTIFPCIGQCELGGDCKDLGITLFNRSIASPPPPASQTSDKSRACSMSGRNFSMVMTMMIMMVEACIALTFLA